MEFGFDLRSCTLSAGGTSVPIILVGLNKDPYFRANDVAAILGYTQPAVAINRILRNKNVKSMEELIQMGVNVSVTPTDKNVLKTRYISEPGLYRLVGHSKLPMAEAFQDWVYAEVLPSIRKSGKYSVPLAPESPVLSNDNLPTWGQQRVNGIEVHKLKCAKLKEIIDSCFSTNAITVYGVVNHLCNQAVLGYSESTKDFKSQKGFPKYMSVADFLDPYAQVIRCSTETAFYKYIVDNLEELKNLPQWLLIQKFEALSKNLLEGHKKTGFADLSDRLLSLDDARTYKKRLNSERKAGLLTPSQSVALLKNSDNLPQTLKHQEERSITSFFTPRA